MNHRFNAAMFEFLCASDMHGYAASLQFQTSSVKRIFI